LLIRRQNAEKGSNGPGKDRLDRKAHLCRVIELNRYESNKQILRIYHDLYPDEPECTVQNVSYHRSKMKVNRYS
jgi:hypothetical protein